MESGRSIISARRCAWLAAYCAASSRGVQRYPSLRIRHNLALLAAQEGRHEEAEAGLRQALSILEKRLGSEHRYTATILLNLGDLYQEQDRLSEAETCWLRSLAIRKKVLGPEHLDTLNLLQKLVYLRHKQGKMVTADELLKEV